MKIGVDFDETSVNYIDPFCLYHNSVYGTSLSRKDVFTYKLEEGLGISKEEAVKRVYAFQKSHHFVCGEVQIIAASALYRKS